MATIIERIQQLEAEKQKLLSQAKDEALANAKRAVAELNSLGYHYRLVEEDHQETTATGRGRRTGVKEEVVALLKKSSTGLTKRGILEAMQVTDKSHENSISNALSTLKAKGTITRDDNGIWSAT